jgi:glycosyltransferase involved in cell wall biosynthesis
LVLVEAMALSKPVVATDAGGPVEIVEHEKTGLLVLPGVADEMAKAILGLLADPARREAMGREGYNRFAERFCAEVMARGTHAVYRKALATREPLPAGEALAVEHEPSP